MCKTQYQGYCKAGNIGGKGAAGCLECVGGVRHVLLHRASTSPQPSRRVSVGTKVAQQPVRPRALQAGAVDAPGRLMQSVVQRLSGDA
jgi:hypothetical protein